MYSGEINLLDDATLSAPAFDYVEISFYAALWLGMIVLSVAL